MKGVYTATGLIAGLTGNHTIAYLTAPSTKIIEILKAELSNSSNSTNVQMDCIIARITTLGAPAGFSGVTPAKHEPGDQAAAATFFISSVGGGEPTTYGDTMIRRGVPSLIGMNYEPAEEERIFIALSAIVGFKINNLPPATGADTIVRVTWREIG